MAGTSARMLSLLSLLQTHRSWTGSELSRRLEVSARTLRRDVDRLRDLGYPVDAVRGSAGGYQLRSGTDLPPLLLEDEEAVAIAVGLRAAAGGMVAGIEDSSVRALSKLVQVMPPRLRRRLDALQESTVPTSFTGGPRIDAELLTTLAQACRDDERARFDYAAYDGTRSSRRVEPHRLVSVGRRWYLLAWDLDREDWRIFRLDRITDAASTQLRFRPREIPGGDASEYVRTRLRSIPQRHRVRVLVEADAAAVQAVVGRWAQVEAVTDARCRLAMEVDDLGWPLMALAAVDAPFTVEGPEELREELGRVAALFAASR